MNAITMTETTAQRDTERVREHAPKLLAALQALLDMDTSYGRGPAVQIAEQNAREAIKYATGANDPSSYPEDGYEVDAAGTFTG